MIVDSNIAAPLQYVDATFQVSLFIRSNIYDMSGGSPTLENTVNLAQINNGVYQGKYTFTAGKPYLVQTLVYTDGTYATVDQTYGQSVDEVQCIDLKTATIATLVTTAHFDAVIGTPAGASIAADLAEIEAETDGIAAIPTTPVLTAHFDTVIGTPAGASIAADLAEIEAETDGIAAIPTVAPDNAGIAAIKAKTDNLPAAPANEVTSAAIKAKTDNLPAAPANEVTSAAIKAKTDNLPAAPANEVTSAAIKAKTDLLPASPANEVTSAAIKAKTDNLPSDPADESVVEAAINAAASAILVVLGTPAGASLAADLAEIEGETDTIATLETDAAALTRYNNVIAAIGGGGGSSGPNPDVGLVACSIEGEDPVVQVSIQGEDTEI